MVEETIKCSSGHTENRATIKFFRMLVKGIEPPAYALRVRCSTPELHQLKADFSVKQKILYNFHPETQAYFSLFPHSPELLFHL